MRVDEVREVMKTKENIRTKEKIKMSKDKKKTPHSYFGPWAQGQDTATPLMLTNNQIKRGLCVMSF